jgi:hypothetical protein
MSEKKRSKKNALIVLLIYIAILTIAYVAIITQLQESVETATNEIVYGSVKIDPEWENVESYDVIIQPIPWIDVDRKEIENKISNNDFLGKVDAGKIKKVRYVIQDHSVKLYGHEPELVGNIFVGKDLYSTELVPEHKRKDGSFIVDSIQPENGEEVVFGEITMQTIIGAIAGKIMIPILDVASAILFVILIYKIVRVVKNKEYETREEEK